MADRDARFFSDIANCYAFAVKCSSPEGVGQARPGGAKTAGDLQTYAEALKDGVLSDGGNKVKFIGSYSIQNVPNIPEASADWYLIAMLVNKNGFHFVRRQRKKFSGQPFWKWKEGNKGMEERNAFDVAAKSYIRITDAQLPSLLKGGYVTDVAGWKFDTLYFFEVHKDGFTVSNTP